MIPGGEYWKKFAKEPRCIQMDTREAPVIAQKMQELVALVKATEATRQHDTRLTKRQKQTTVTEQWFLAIARYEETVVHLAPVDDPWRRVGRDMRCASFDVPVYQCGDGTNFIESNNAYLDMLSVSNNTGIDYGVGLYIDGVVAKNDNQRRKAGTEDDYVHHDRQLAMRRNERSTQLGGALVYPNLLKLVPDKPGVKIVEHQTAKHFEKPAILFVGEVRRLRESTEKLRCEVKLPALLLGFAKPGPKVAAAPEISMVPMKLIGGLDDSTEQSIVAAAPGNLMGADEDMYTVLPNLDSEMKYAVDNRGASLNLTEKNWWW
jgi:hypothetical protein